MNTALIRTARFEVQDFNQRDAIVMDWHPSLVAEGGRSALVVPSALNHPPAHAFETQASAPVADTEVVGKRPLAALNSQEEKQVNA